MMIRPSFEPIGASVSHRYPVSIAEVANCAPQKQCFYEKPRLKCGGRSGQICDALPVAGIN